MSRSKEPHHNLKKGIIMACTPFSTCISHSLSPFPPPHPLYPLAFQDSIFLTQNIQI